MSIRMSDRLVALRRSRFVGRSAELELFQAALSRDVPDFAVLHIYGPGGMGKTTLLREFARLAAEAGRTPVTLDARYLDASPSGFLTALQMALNLPPEQPPLDAVGAMPGLVLLIDTCELLAPLDAWLRDLFLPQLQERALVVMAGRQQPAAAWRADDGWGALTRIVSLRNLRPEESAAYLTARGIAAQDVDCVLAVTYGHPLALALVADLYKQNNDLCNDALQRDPDIVRVLLERFVAEVPNPMFRQALEVCAHAFTTDESLLAACLGAEQSYTAFQWLRNLSFIEQGPFGLFPHDLAREVLEADLRWRNLPRFREVHFQVRTHIIEQIMTTSGMAQQSAFEYLRMPVAPDGAFTMDGQQFGVFVHNWRAEPVLAWLEIMGERELLDEIVALEALPHTPQPVALSEPEFAEAVRQALRDVRRPDLLAQNPLLRSRCVREHSDQEPTPASLQALLRAGALTATSKLQKLHKVLWHTFFEPAPTPEAAAELLDLPFSTYRYQLGKAMEQLTGWLWQREVYGSERLGEIGDWRSLSLPFGW